MPEYNDNAPSYDSSALCGNHQTIQFRSHPRELLNGPPKDHCAYPKSHGKTPHEDEDVMNKILHFSYTTRYQAEYGPGSGVPYTRRPPPKFHESKPDQVSWKGRVFYPPQDKIRLNMGTPGKDPDRGHYEWREMTSRPGDLMWQALERKPFDAHTDHPKPQPPPKVSRHNTIKEMERWENILELNASNCLSYGYRQHMPGYGGYVNTLEHVDSQVGRGTVVGDSSKAMESTVQASYSGECPGLEKSERGKKTNMKLEVTSSVADCKGRKSLWTGREHPGNFYDHGGQENANKHKGPLSRMVTLTHPFNPFTQQSAYSNMGATDTTTGCSK